jgi:Uma2 family endonuclease
VPTALTETLVDPPRKQWTRRDCVALAASGSWDEHLELVDGELISRLGKKRPHTNSLTSIHGWLGRVFGYHYINPGAPIDVAPVDIPTNEPVPDIIVLSRPSHEIRDANPQPSDLRLVVEVSDSTVGFDRTVKARLYARAGIAEYWVVDIPSRRIIVHRDPRDGQYRSVTAYSDQESVRPLAAPDAEFSVASAFVE